MDDAPDRDCDLPRAPLRLPSNMLPDSFPPQSTVYRWFARFRDDGTSETVNHDLVTRDREGSAARRPSGSLRWRSKCAPLERSACADCRG